MMVAMALNYTYRAEWDPARLEYFARCLEFPGRYAEAFTAHEAIAALEARSTSGWSASSPTARPLSD
jgi:hypothetical protein